MKLYVGDDTGLVKGVAVEAKKSVSRWGVQDRAKEPVRMCWGPDEGQKNLVIGRKNAVVEVYDVNTGSIVKEFKQNGGPIVGLQMADSNLVTCSEKGKILYRDWESQETKFDLDTKLDISRLRVNPQAFNQIAIGGKENDMKVFDIETQSYLFKAKNVTHDEVDLRVPVWVTDLHFVPETNGQQIVVTTAHHHVRLYDARAHRKPVANLAFGDHPIMSLGMSHDGRSAIFANSIGEMRAMDIQTRRLSQGFKGASGSIRSIMCHDSLPFVASVGLDRYARVHNINTGKLISQVYLKQRLNCTLFANEGVVKIVEPKHVKPKEEGNEKEAEKEEEVPDVDVWDTMVEVEDDKDKKQIKRKSKAGVTPAESTKAPKKKKKSDE